MCISKNPVYAGYVTWGKRTSVTRMNADGHAFHLTRRQRRIDPRTG